MEFRGAIEDEADCYDGGTVAFDESGVVNLGMTENEIEALWCIGDIAWTYKTEIPHETFKVMEYGKIYCIGIVFCINDLQ